MVHSFALTKFKRIMTQAKANKTTDVFPSAFTDFFDNDKFFSNHWIENALEQNLPAVNIKEKDNAFDVELAAPGFSKADIKIDVDDHTMTISAEKEKEKNVENERFTRKEFSYNSFRRSFTLPQSVDTDRIVAKYNDGILKLQVPKKEASKTLPKKKIEIA
jgi:HSP20 family protein